MKCKKCGEDFDSTVTVFRYCSGCNENLWQVWLTEEAYDLEKIKEIQAQGHSHHCACRQVWGDGECECELYKHGYDPYGWMKGKPLKETIKDIDKAYKAAEDEKQK